MNYSVYHDAMDWFESLSVEIQELLTKEYPDILDNLKEMVVAYFQESESKGK